MTTLLPLPLLRAHAKHFGKMALVHFDAHTDTYANGCEFDHGTMFYTAPNEGLIDPNHSVQIGIRTEFDKDNGFTVLDAGQVNDRSVDDVIAQVKQIVGDMPVYLTFDIDCLDPAFCARHRDPGYRRIDLRPGDQTGAWPEGSEHRGDGRSGSRSGLRSVRNYRSGGGDSRSGNALHPGGEEGRISRVTPTLSLPGRGLRAAQRGYQGAGRVLLCAGRGPARRRGVIIASKHVKRIFDVEPDFIPADVIVAGVAGNAQHRIA